MIAFVAAAASAFNLTCVVTSFGFMGEMPKRPETPMTNEFRVDLATRRFCEGDCRSTMPIAKITETDLFLKLTDEPRLKEFLRISRESGEMLSQWQIGGSAESTEAGSCQVSAFTGFPAQKF